MSIAIILTQAAAVLNLGVCPAAYINYEYWSDHRNNITRTVPVEIVMGAVRGLRECKRNGIDVPNTVDQYNAEIRNQRRRQNIESREVERMVNHSGRPFHEQ